MAAVSGEVAAIVEVVAEIAGLDDHAAFVEVVEIVVCVVTGVVEVVAFAVPVAIVAIVENVVAGIAVFEYAAIAVSFVIVEFVG